MGARRERRIEFFKNHPNCCFCGGLTPATTEDHQPARTFFFNRQWPEGFVFPACQPCNDATRKSEKIISLLANGHADKVDRKEYQDLVASIRRDYPGVIESMIPSSANEVRRILRDNGLRKPEGQSYKEMPLVKLERDFWDEHFSNFSRKLLLALHYQCFGIPLSMNGGISFWVHTNFDWAAGRFPKEIIDMAGNIAVPSRQKKYLGDQFSIRWSYVDDPRTALFVTHLHGSITISGITTENPGGFKENKNRKMVRPWAW